jgi:uncharacterized delta-60 repeat protein
MKTLLTSLRLSLGFALSIPWLVLAGGGSVDPAFQPPAFGFGISRVAVQADGKVLIVGGMRVDASPEPLGLQRLNADGSRDPDFNIGSGFVGQTTLLPGVFTNVAAPQFYALVPTPAGILVGGQFDSLNGQPRTNLVRVLGSGAVDAGFVAQADGLVNAILPVAGGQVLVAGGFKKINGTARASLARLNANGSVDNFTPNWGSLIPSAIRTLAVQADGKILVGGGFLSLVGGLSTKLVARLNADGSVDSSFTPAGAQFTTEYVSGLVVQADGKIVVIGGFGQIGGNARKAIARLNSDGTFDSTWPGPGIGSGGLESAEALAAAANGQLFLGGKFATYNGQGPDGIARLNADGTRDGTFQKPAGSSTFWVGSLAVQADGKILMGGTFTLGVQTVVLLRLLDKDAGPPPAPTITQQPANLTANLGATGKTLTVEATGAPPLAYRWQFKGADLQFKTEATLAFLSPIRESDAGDYRVIVSNAGGAVTSSVATVSVIVPARVVSPPANLTVNVGERATFTFVPGGTPPFAYQWRKNLENLPDATNATFTIPQAKLTDMGGYSVAVTNPAGGESSVEATLTVKLAKPVIKTQPLAQTVTLPDTNLTATILSGRQLCLTVSGALPPWSTRGGYCITFTGGAYASPAGGALANASTGGFTVHPGTAPPATLIDFANFFPDGQTATLTLLANGIFEFNRASLVANQNGTWALTPPFVPPALPTVKFSVVASGDGTLTYQWFKGIQALPGQTGPGLTLNNLSVDDAGDYTVVVTNGGGSTISEIAKLTVNAVAVPYEVKLVRAGTSGLSVQTPTTLGKTYTLEQRSALAGAAWSTVRSLAGDGLPHAFAISASEAAAFYRITELP